MRRGFLQRIGREDGAIAVMGSIFLLVSLAASALAVDVGSVVFEQREARKVADLAALDAVLVFTDRAADFADPQAGAEQLALESAANNDFVPGGDRTLTTDVGRWDAATGTFSPGIVAANAVRVTATDMIGYHFRPGGGQVSATAISSTENIAGIAIGTGLAEIDSSESALLGPLMNGLLGANLGLTAVHYNGIADLDVPIGVLGTHLGVGAGGIDEFLATQVSVKSLAKAFADANPDKVGVTAEALGILAGLGTNQAQAQRFALGEILTVAAEQVTGDAFADAEVNALTMLMAAAQMANKNNAVALDVGAAIPSLTGGTLAGSTLRLVVIEPPQIAIGPARKGADDEWVTVARSAQVRLAINTSVDLTTSLLGGLLPARINLPLYVGAAEGTAALTANRCGEPGQMTTAVDTGGVTLKIGDATNAQLISGAEPTGPAKLVTLRANVLLLGSINVADVFASANATVAAGSGDLTFDGPFDWDNVQHLSHTTNPKGLLLSNLNVTHTLLGSSLLSWILSAVTSTVTTVITPLVQQLLNGLYDGVLDPVLGLLGADLAGADVTAWHQDCGPRVLVQ